MCWVSPTTYTLTWTLGLRDPDFEIMHPESLTKFFRGRGARPEEVNGHVPEKYDWNDHDNQTSQCVKGTTLVSGALTGGVASLLAAAAAEPLLDGLEELPLDAFAVADELTRRELRRCTLHTHRHQASFTQIAWVLS